MSTKRKIGAAVLAGVILIGIVLGGVWSLMTINGLKTQLAAQPETQRESVEYSADTVAEIDALRKLGKPVIVYFGADYCPTCVNHLPYIQALNEEYGDEIIIKHVDTVAHEVIRKEYNIELIPSTIFFNKDGSVFRPSVDLELDPPEETDAERKHKSDTVRIADADVFGLHPYFEYGVDENEELVYSKYVGLLKMTQLKEIAEILLAE